MTEPIDINRSGQAGLAVGETETGEYRPIAVDNDGNLQVDVGSVDGPVNVEELPTAAAPTDADPNIATSAIAARMQAWIGSAWARVPLYSSPVLASDFGFGVHIATAPVLTTAPETTFTIQPADNTAAQAVRLVGMGQQSTANSLSIVPGTDYNATSIPTSIARGLVVRLARTGQVTTAESQSITLSSDHRGLDPGQPLYVQQSDGVGAIEGATEGTLSSLLTRKRLEVVLGHGEQRVAGRTLIAEFSPPYVENTDLFGFVGTGTHAIDTALRAQRISVSGTAGETMTWQSHTRYQFPASQPVAIYGVVAFSDAGQTNQVRRIVIGDADEYLGIELSGTTLAVVGKSLLSGVTFAIPRAAWLDPLDGTGPSGFTLDLTAFNTFEAILGVPGIVGGYATINEIPILSLPAFTNAAALLKHQEHSLSAIILNTSASVAGSVYIRGFGVYALGDYDLRIIPSPVPVTHVSRSVDTTGLPVLSIRPKATLGGVTWRGLLLPRTLSLTASGNGVNYQLWLNPATLTGPSWVSAGAALGLEYDVSATAFTGGTPLASGFVSPDASGIEIDLTPVFEEHPGARPIRTRVDGTPDTLVVRAFTSLGLATTVPRLLVDVVG